METIKSETKNVYDSIYRHSLSNGFDEELAMSAARELSKLSSEFLNIKEATIVFPKTYSNNIIRPFRLHQLQKFVEEVRNHSFKADEFELEEKLGMFPDEAKEMYRYGDISKEEFNKYLKEVWEYEIKTRNRRELTTLTNLQSGAYYPILYGQVLRKIVPIDMGQKFHMISVPTGGQPGFRRKRRVR